jgi:lysozyme family protein
MKDFDESFKRVVGLEGGLSEDPHDPGNWTGGSVGVGQLLGTRYGISAASYPKINIRNLTQDMAREIYQRDYWKPCHCDDLAWPLCLVVFDCAVNCGTGTATRLLQQAIGVLDDGIIGPRTLAQVRALGPVEASALLLRARSSYYRKLKGWPRYGDGWINRLFRLALGA